MTTLLIYDQYQSTKEKTIAVKKIDYNKGKASVVLLPQLGESLLKQDVFQNVCDDYLVDAHDFSSWSNDRREEIKEYYRKLALINVEHAKLDFISVLSGVGVLRGRALLTKNRKVLPQIASDNAKVMTDSANNLFSLFMQENKFQELLELFSDKKIPLDYYAYFDFKVLPPISHIILKDHTINGLYFVRELIELGAKPKLIDLVTATKLGLPVEFVDRLYMAGEIDPSKVFLDTGFYSSLTLEAVKANSADLVSYWLSLNSPPSPDKFHFNALDLLKLPEENTGYNKYEEIFLMLMKEGVRPNYKSTIERLSISLPSELKIKFQNFYSEINGRTIPKEWKPFVHVNVFELYKLALKGRVRYEGTDIITNRCFLLMGNKVISDIFAKKSKKVADKINNNTHIQSVDDIAKKTLHNILSDGISIEDALASFSGQYDLTSKLVLNELLALQVKQQFEEKNEISKANISNKDKELVDVVLDGLPNKDWVSIEESVEKLGGVNEVEKLNILLQLSLLTRENWSVIKSFLDRGAILPVNTILILAQNNDASLARKLMNYRLNINFVDPMGKNAYYYSVTFSANEIILFLLEHKVDININSLGLDPLDLALSLLEYQKNMMKIIGLLINGGIRIQESHKERVNYFKMVEPDIYKDLTDSFPQLI